MNLIIGLRRAIRALLRTPSFALPLIATVALATAMVATTWAIVYGILFRPLPYPQDDQLVVVGTHYGASSEKPSDMSPPDFADRASSRSFQSAAAWRSVTAVIAGANPIRVSAALVTSGFFRTLGVDPLAGHVTNDPSSVVLSYGAWQRRFGGQPDLVGKTIVVDSTQRVIAAIMPRDFAFPKSDVELWIPLILPPSALSDDMRGTENLEMIARLAPGVTIGSAQAEADVLTPSIIDRTPSRRQFLIDAHWHVVIRGLHASIVENVRLALMLLFVAAALVFAIGAANAAALVLARVASREKETSVRAALGAGRARAAAPRLAETCLATVVGGASGIALIFLFTGLVSRNAGGLIGRPEAIALDAPVLGFALLVVALISLIAAAAASIQPRLSGSVPGRFGSVAVARFRSALVVVEIALATALLIAGALVIESVKRLAAGDPGFRPKGVLTFRITAPPAIANDTPRLVAFYAGIQERLQRLPRVSAISAVSVLPFSEEDETATFNVEGRSAAPGVPMPSGKYRRILPGWPAAVGIPILAGRTFDSRDVTGAPRVVVIDEAAAKLYWQGRNPVGQRITYSNLSGRVVNWREVIGVVGSIRHGSLGEQPVPHVYICALQAPEQTMTFLVRSDLPDSALVPEVRAAVRAVDPMVPVDRIETLESYVAGSLAQPRFGSAILSAFALVALFLTAIGIYGLLAYLVTGRRREFAIRMALGAGTGTVLLMVVRSGMRLALLGTAVGIAGALAARSVLSSVLYSVTATDPLAYAGVTVTLVAIAALASFVPALRAARLDPAVALRTE